MPGVLDLLRGSKSPAAARLRKVEATLYSGTETLEVVGESHYQDALWQIVGGRRPDHVRYETFAVLVPDAANPYDPNAIEVQVAGALVGYLSRDDAARYRPGVLRLMETGPTGYVALPAVIVGGGQRDDGIGFLGVFLDHDPSDFGVPTHHAPGHLRTGWSEALATDLEDETYDLSWDAELSSDDATAIEQLRVFLDVESDRIDRHYMLCELEHRLYKSRAASPSALDEFDAVCAQHDGEMVTLRPALVAKFGAVPAIDMYRQATIRCQKAKRWEAAREWAERGISVYGQQAARPEVVEDLHKRIAYATAKIEGPNQPRVRKPNRVAFSSSTRATEMETLECASCGQFFERVRARGRKPKLCPTCRGSVTSR